VTMTYIPLDTPPTPDDCWDLAQRFLEACHGYDRKCAWTRACVACAFELWRAGDQQVQDQRAAAKREGSTDGAPAPVVASGS
jgi:hypothetical protein